MNLMQKKSKFERKLRYFCFCLCLWYLALPNNTPTSFLFSCRLVLHSGVEIIATVVITSFEQQTNVFPMQKCHSEFQSIETTVCTKINVSVTDCWMIAVLTRSTCFSGTSGYILPRGRNVRICTTLFCYNLYEESEHYAQRRELFFFN